MKQQTKSIAITAAIGAGLILLAKKTLKVSGVGVLSPYVITWAEVYSQNGVITKSDANKLGGGYREGGNKYLYLHFPNKAAAYGWIDRMQNTNLDKTYEVRFFTDKQFGLRKESDGYRVPFTKMQRENVFYI